MTLPNIPTQSKPPTIRVGVHGFNAFETKQSQPTDNPSAIDWPLLESLPPFQMFLAEKRVKSQRTQDFYEDYCRWHKAKGYWLNEDAHGRSL